MGYHLYVGLLILPFALAALAVGYLLGSIPFGLILTQLAGTGDIRSVGSGNIGATNVLRTGRNGLAATTLLGDMLKGTAAVLIMNRIDGTDAALVAGLGAVLGHVFPVWLRFKGGKGVATYIGVLRAVAGGAALAFGVVGGVGAGQTRYSSLSALLASLIMPVLLFFFVDWKPALLFFVLTVLIWIMHRGEYLAADRRDRKQDRREVEPPPLTATNEGGTGRANEWAELQENSFPISGPAFVATNVGKGTALLDVGCGAGLAGCDRRKRAARRSAVSTPPRVLRRSPKPEPRQRHPRRRKRGTAVRRPQLRRHYGLRIHSNTPPIRCGRWPRRSA